MSTFRNKLSYFKTLYQMKRKDYPFLSARIREKPACRQVRARLAFDTPLLLPDGSSFVFLNRLTYYAILLNIHGTLATTEELADICKVIKASGYSLCTMTVWSSKDGLPVLVKMNPGHKKPVKVIRTPSSYCLAYAFFIPPEK